MEGNGTLARRPGDGNMPAGVVVEWTPMISVVIPVLNEAANLARLLPVLTVEAEIDEILVVDGGSDDGSADLARRLGARVLIAGRGRGRQLAAGGAEARGEVLLFLHADCVLPPGSGRAVVRALAAQPAAVGGNFRLRFDGGDAFARWLDGFYDWIRAHGVYYGDSGIFARREAYAALGGIRPIALMEDYDFTRRLERLGPTVMVETPALVTSSRRFAGRRPWRIVAGWLWIHLLFHLGVSPERLARIYNSARRA